MSWLFPIVQKKSSTTCWSSLDWKLDSGTLLTPSLARSSSQGKHLLPAQGWLLAQGGQGAYTPAQVPTRLAVSSVVLLAFHAALWHLSSQALASCFSFGIQALALLPWATLSYPNSSVGPTCQRHLLVHRESLPRLWKSKVTIKERHWCVAKSRLMLLLEIQGSGRFSGEHLQWIKQLCQVELPLRPLQGKR